jgi:hydrogenase nickel incorporation protein HypB
LPYVKFEVAKVKQYARQINPAIEFVEVSCTSGEGLTNWYDWLQHEQVEKTFVKV